MSILWWEVPWEQPSEVSLEAKEPERDQAALNPVGLGHVLTCVPLVVPLLSK